MGVKLRILVVSRRLYPPNGGGELSLLSIARHLQQNGATVELAYHGERAPAGFQTHPLPQPFHIPGMWNLQLANHGAWTKCVAKLIRDREPDLVLTQQEATSAAVDAARAEGVRSIAMIRGTDFLELPSLRDPGAWRHHAQRLAFNHERARYLTVLTQADAVIANSQFIAAHYEPLIGRMPAVVHPAIDCPRVRVNSLSGHFVMFTPHAHKGGHIVLEMARRMPKRKFVVAGNGDREILDALQHLDNVEYHPWTANPNSLFKGAAATLMPTQMYEAFGRVAIESLAHGVPVLASNRGGLPEAVGQAGILIREWDNPGAWCRAASELLNDPLRYAAICRTTLAHASDFDPDVKINTFDSIVRRTMHTPRRARVTVAGIPVDPVTQGQAAREIERACREDRQIAVATVNSEFIVQSLDDAAFRHALQRVDLAVPDSFGMSIALSHRGISMERCPGIDLTYRLAARGLRLFLLGSTQPILDAAAKRLAAANPATEIGTFAPPFGDLEGALTDTMIARVNAFAPDVLLVALGAPRQDIWIARNLPRLRTHAAIGVGGSFDMISGVLARCPAFWGRIGLEWAYRLLQEPWRWRRCMRLVRFLPLALQGDRP